MEKMEYQVEKEKLKDPVRIETVRKNGLIESRMDYLNGLQIYFAVEESDSVFEIFVGEKALES